MEESSMQLRASQATTDKEHTKLKIEALKRTLDSHLLRLNSILNGPEVNFDRLASAIQGLDVELRAKLAESGDLLQAAPSDGTYEVLRNSLNETQKRCKDLNDEMLRVADANEELHNTLRSLKATNRRLVEEVQKQTEELSTLTQQRLGDMEKLSKQEEAFSREKASWVQDAQKTLEEEQRRLDEDFAEMQEALNGRLDSCWRKAAAAKVKTDALRGSQRQLKSDVQSFAHAFSQGLKGVERELLDRIAAEEKKMRTELNRLQDLEHGLEVRVKAEREVRANEVQSWRSRHAALATDLEALITRRDQEVFELQSKVNLAISSRESQESSAKQERAALQEKAEALSKDVALVEAAEDAGDEVLRRYGDEAVYFVEVCGLTSKRALMETSLKVFADECEKLSDRSRFAYLQHELIPEKDAQLLELLFRNLPGVLPTGPVRDLFRRWPQKLAPAPASLLVAGAGARTPLRRPGLEAPQWFLCLSGRMRLKMLPDERCEGGRLAPLAPQREPFGLLDEAGKPLFTICEHSVSEVDLFAAERHEPCSAADLDSFGPDLHRFPEAANLPKALEVLLLPGELVVVSAGWWVQCYCDEASWAVHSQYAEGQGLGRLLDSMLSFAGTLKEEIFGYDALPAAEQVDAALAAVLEKSGRGPGGIDGIGGFLDREEGLEIASLKCYGAQAGTTQEPGCKAERLPPSISQGRAGSSCDFWELWRVRPSSHYKVRFWDTLGSLRAADVVSFCYVEASVPPPAPAEPDYPWQSQKREPRSEALLARASQDLRGSAVDTLRQRVHDSDEANFWDAVWELAEALAEAVRNNEARLAPSEFGCVQTPRPREALRQQMEVQRLDAQTANEHRRPGSHNKRETPHPGPSKAWQRIAVS
ncbi:unnamed protein product [Symbiodinium sp. CCMP2592]|nr:unnamed protein product [Symbiodinium sp. CCMP2592]